MPEAFFPMEWKNYEKTDLYERCQKTEPLPVKADGGICWGEQPQDHVLAREDLRSEEKHVYALVKKEEKQEKKVFLPKQLQAPVKEGQKIGRVCYYVEGELLREIPLYSDRQITKMTFGNAGTYFWSVGPQVLKFSYELV